MKTSPTFSRRDVLQGSAAVAAVERVRAAVLSAAPAADRDHAGN